MDKLFFKPDHAWVGDLIPYYENGTYYAYYLHDPRITPGEFAEQTTWHLATTEDCRKFRYQGEAIARGGDDRPNKNIYTGSVIKKGEMNTMRSTLLTMQISGFMARACSP